ncbi:MAG: hypothetical protein HFJ34_02245 [Clostridia bacterium]|nr:hypothetical protein [Clostridia bacterium]
MNKETIKKIMVALMISIIIIIIIVIVLLTKIEKKQENNHLNLNDELIEENIEETQKIVTDEERIEKYDFLVVSNCVTTYLSGINQESSSYYGRDENNNYTKVVEQETINKNAYNLLSTEYIEKNKITLNNVYQYVPKVNQKLMFVPIDMKLKSSDSVNKYKVYGYVTDFQYNFISNLYVIVNLDIENKTFSIEPINEQIYQEQKIENNNIKIEKNDNNQYTYEQLSEEYRLKQYFQNYKMMLLSNVELAYEFLEDTYKKKCFGNIDNFKKYVDENKNKFIGITLSEYDAKTQGDMTQYIEKDAKENYYVFNISNINPTEFTVMLDIYTISLPKVEEEYKKSNAQEKVSMNTMRFINAINDKKYYYAYNLLAQSFKNRNFQTQEEFETYIKDNFFENNIIEEASFKEESGYYVYILTLSDGNGNTKKANIVMELGEGIDFAMSFSIE